MANSVTPTLRQRSIETARTVLQNKPIYLDTETTGLGPNDEIIEISIIDEDGSPLFESLVKPSQLVPANATEIHHITNEELQTARTWPVLWPQVRAALFGRMIVMYNAPFDMRMLQQSHERYRLPWKERFNAFDLLKLYSEFRGDWDPRRKSYKYYSLDAAGKMCGISLPNAHRSTADTLLTRALLHYLAEQEA